MLPKVIHCQADLNALVEQISAAPWLALDTEFMRESTYYPELCLIQVATPDVSACIDVPSLDHIEPLLALLRQDTQTKIFHSCRQDLEVFYCTYNFIPRPVFDTQIAASILGLNEQISYAELVAYTCAIQLSKTESRTDWRKRPLTDAQIDYALDDVNHLGELYENLRQSLETKGRMQWLDEECEQLSLADNYFILPEEAWTLVKGTGKLSARQFYYLRKLAAWREATAQQKNLPRRWILPDPAMFDLLQLKDTDETSVESYLKKNATRSQRHRTAITEILQQSIAQQEIATLPVPVDQRLTPEQRQLVKKLMQHTRKKALQMETSASLLANRKSLVNLVLGTSSKVSHGWRKQVIGYDLNKLIQSGINETTLPTSTG